MRALRWVWIAGCGFAALAVALGAFGAHALSGLLDERGRALWQTAVQYQFAHALGLLAAALAAGPSLSQRPSRACGWAARSFVVGIVVFSGSLYALALGAPRGFGAITPIGGVAFLIGWIALSRAAFEPPRPHRTD